MAMTDILSEPEGSDITIISVQEYIPWKHGNKCRDNILTIVYKDANNRKRIRMVKNPAMEIYCAKPDHRNFKTPREYFSMEDTYSIKVPAKSVMRAIAKEAEKATDPISRRMSAQYNQASQTSDRAGMKEIFKWPYTMMSDMSTEDYYRVMLGVHYNTMRNHLVDTAYLDIETDVYNLSTTEISAHMAPINACTVAFTFDKNRDVKKKSEVYTFLLRNHRRYKGQAEMENNLNDFIRKAHSELDHQKIVVGGEERIFDFDANYHVKFYDSELDLIVSVWNTINSYRPDVLGGWNVGFDINEFVERLKILGKDPRDIMCDPLFPEDIRFVEVNIDRRPIDVANRKTSIRLTSTMVINDNMQSFAGMRKGGKSYGSNSLDNVANHVMGLGKLKFPKGIDVKNAAIFEYVIFSLYNIFDVIRLLMIDLITNDSMAMVYDMNQSNCPWENLFKQTRYQKQIYYANYLRRGFVPGNNANIRYAGGETEENVEKKREAKMKQRRRMEIDEDTEFTDVDEPDYDPEVEVALSEFEEDDDSEPIYNNDVKDALDAAVDDLLVVYNDYVGRTLAIPGGMVGNPDFNSENGYEILPGVFSKHIYKHVIDMDYFSEYPWAKYTRSMSRSTQIGRLVISEKISDRQNSLPAGRTKRAKDMAKYLPGAEFVEDYISHDPISFGNVWFNLPTVAEMERKMMEKLCSES